MASRRVPRGQSTVGATDVLLMLQRMIDEKEREVSMLRGLLAEIHSPSPHPEAIIHSKCTAYMSVSCRRCSGDKASSTSSHSRPSSRWRTPGSSSPTTRSNSTVPARCRTGGSSSSVRSSSVRSPSVRSQSTAPVKDRG